MPDRRCLTQLQMLAKGWAKDSREFWKRGGRFVPIVTVSAP